MIIHLIWSIMFAMDCVRVVEEARFPSLREAVLILHVMHGMMPVTNCSGGKDFFFLRFLKFSR